MKQASPTPRVLASIGSVSVLVGLVVLYNLWFHVFYGEPRIPMLEGRWWAGYYETSLLGHQWCVVRFRKLGTSQFQMVMLSASGAPDLYEVSRSSSSENFVYLTITDPNSTLRMEAKQLYNGARYYFGRLSVGLWRDFWKMNEDISIRGNVVSAPPPNEFAIEPTTEEQLSQFWKEYVRPEEPHPTPAELVRSVGFELGEARHDG